VATAVAFVVHEAARRRLIHSIYGDGYDFVELRGSDFAELTGYDFAELTGHDFGSSFAELIYEEIYQWNHALPASQPCRDGVWWITHDNFAELIYDVVVPRLVGPDERFAPTCKIMVPDVTPLSVARSLKSGRVFVANDSGEVHTITSGSQNGSSGRLHALHPEQGAKEMNRDGRNVGYELSFNTHNTDNFQAAQRMLAVTLIPCVWATMVQLLICDLLAALVLANQVCQTTVYLDPGIQHWNVGGELRRFQDELST